MAGQRCPAGWTGRRQLAGPQQHSYAIGMVVPSLDYYWPQVISGARAEAEEQNLRILVRGSAYDAADNRRQVQALLDNAERGRADRGPDMTGEQGQELLRWLNALPIPWCWQNVGRLSKSLPTGWNGWPRTTPSAPVWQSGTCGRRGTAGSAASPIPPAPPARTWCAVGGRRLLP
jgi:hypothetical protein